MKLHTANAGAANTITAYGDDYVKVNGERRQQSLIVTADGIEPWTAASFDALSAADFTRFTELGVEIVVLGTGPRQRFPHPRITASLTNAHVGLEVMDTKAACRTYNILVAEARRVALALVFT